MWVRFCISTAPVYGCQYFDIVVYDCKSIAIVNFQLLIKEIFIYLYTSISVHDILWCTVKLFDMKCTT